MCYNFSWPTNERLQKMNTLQHLRKRAGYKSADEFAAALGMNARTYRNYENGNSKIHLELACRMCDVLKCTLNELANRPIPQIDKLTAEEQHIISCFRAMSSTRKNALLVISDDCAAFSSPSQIGGIQF